MRLGGRGICRPGDGVGCVAHRGEDVRLEAALVHERAVGGAGVPEERLARVPELDDGVEARARGVLEHKVAAGVPPKGVERLRPAARERQARPGVRVVGRSRADPRQRVRIRAPQSGREGQRQEEQGFSERQLSCRQNTGVPAQSRRSPQRQSPSSGPRVCTRRRRARSSSAGEQCKNETELAREACENFALQGSVR